MYICVSASKARYVDIVKIAAHRLSLSVVCAVCTVYFKFDFCGVYGKRREPNPNPECCECKNVGIPVYVYVCSHVSGLIRSSISFSVLIDGSSRIL